MIDAAHWRTLSALFDEALALPPAARPDWLAALHARDARLGAAMTRMLAQAAAESDDDDDATDASPASAFDGLLRRALHVAPPPAATAWPGRRLGAWELQAPIGEGGMGQVWVARRCDGLYAASAAIKLLRSDRQQAHLLARFARERAALGRLNHSGIARLLDAGVDADGQAYLVLEHVVGRTLAEHVDASCPTVASRVRLVIGVADAVAHAHAQLIVHRDIKPSNLMVTAAGVPKLLDFGIAALQDDEEDEDPRGLTRQSGRPLTLGYAAPELITGASAGVAADVFSLGVVLYEMLAGGLPFVAANGTREAIEHAVLHGTPRRLVDAPAQRTMAAPADLARARGDLEAILFKALRKDPAARYGNVSAFAEDLRRWLESRPVSARRDNRRHAAALWLRRHAVAAGLAAGLVLALSVGLSASVWQWRRAEASARQAEHVTDHLSSLLASASPDASQGRPSDLLELLERSRRELAGRFGDEPEVRLRLLEVLAKTYNDLNRYDLAAPLAQQWVALASERLGEDDPRTLHARLAQARIDVPLGPWEPVVDWLTPLAPTVARVFGARSSEMHDLLLALGNSEVRLGLLDAAERHLEQARLVGLRLFPEGSFERDFHHNYVAGLYAAQGRTRLALEEFEKTARQQRAPPPELQRFALVLRRGTFAMHLRLGDYERIDEQAQALLQESDRLLGPGNALGATIHAELARVRLDRGQFAAARTEHQRVVAATGNGTPTAFRLATRAAELLDRCLLAPREKAALLNEAQRLRAELAAGGEALGNLGAEAGLSLARCGLLLDDEALTAGTLATLHGHPALARSASLAHRVAQVDGEWQRARGDLAASRRLIGERVADLERSPDRRVPALWAARLDLAYTLVLLQDPDAAAAVEAAAAERPNQMPAGHPLDAVQDHLRALIQEQRPFGASGTAATLATANARMAVERAFGRPPGDDPSKVLRLGGMFG